MLCNLIFYLIMTFPPFIHDFLNFQSYFFIYNIRWIRLYAKEIFRIELNVQIFEKIFCIIPFAPVLELASETIYSSSRGWWNEEIHEGLPLIGVSRDYLMTSVASPSSMRRAMMTRMISLVPSRIWCTRASRSRRSSGYSRM